MRCLPPSCACLMVLAYSLQVQGPRRRIYLQVPAVGYAAISLWLRICMGLHRPGRGVPLDMVRLTLDCLQMLQAVVSSMQGAPHPAANGQVCLAGTMAFLTRQKGR